MTQFAQLLKAKGFTQAEIAELASVSQQTVSRWVRGEAEPPAEVIKILTNAQLQPRMVLK